MPVRSIVPNRAVRTVNRQKMVTVMFEGQQMQVSVVTGMSGDSNTEVISGLKEGDVVVIATTTATQNNRVPGVGGGPVMIPAGPGR